MSEQVTNFNVIAERIAVATNSLDKKDDWAFLLDFYANKMEEYPEESMQDLLAPNESMQDTPPEGFMWALRSLKGSTSEWYKFPKPMNELQDIISFLDLNSQLGEIARSVVRHRYQPKDDRIRDLEKIIFYAQAEISRIKEYE